MNFHEFGPRTAPHVMLIHGGGNAWWNYLRQARALSPRYHVILPTLDGHGEEYQIPYRSTEQTADRLMDYILRECGGRLFALGGVSLGGQIVMELLARKSDIAEKAIIDGSLCIPQPVLARFCIASVRLFGPLLFSEKACRRQLSLMDRVLPEEMRYPEEIKAYYLQDMPKLPPGDAVCHVSDLYDAVSAERQCERQRRTGHVLVRGEGDELCQEVSPPVSNAAPIL